MTPATGAPTPSEPAFLDHTQELMKILRPMRVDQVGALMHLSDNLAQLNFDRYQSFPAQLNDDNAKAAALAFRGDTYVGLNADTLSADDFAFAQDHLRILSGLYGILRPLDRMAAYRLEMGTKLANPRGKDLYAFWGDVLVEALNAATEGHADRTLVNLASTEYFKAVRHKKLAGPLVTPIFKEIKNGRASVVGVLAKRARGAMARYIIDNRLDSPEPLKEYAEEGYAFRPELSNASDWVFTRETA
ncbi:putative YaaA-like protein [Magnetofaba australis IT-1]|uniref:UPF0246 protein MAIT1_00118 n=2 Tax=Magnetofaba TaxID=1472292 RepID=A0A1Y2KAN0_9PROT|nr:putative YaaA-like protein [Magnetofaba australis IT-1]